jgi:hypothetical protein
MKPKTGQTMGRGKSGVPRAVKKHKLSIEYISDDSGDVLRYYSKGHHDFDAFKQAVARDQGCKPDEICEPQHDWWRWNLYECGVSAKESGYCGWQTQGTPGKRGSFPVTVSEGLT